MKLRIITYNIHRAIGVDRLFRPERIERILADHSGDLIFLQEVDQGVPRSRRMDMARELAERLGFAHFAVGYNVRLRTGRYGNAIFSRFPIHQATNIDLTIGRRKKRGCQYVQVAVPGGDGERLLTLFNFHLGLLARERRQQVGLLASAPEFLALEPTMPCILGGDSNDWRSLLRPFFVDVLGFRCATDRPKRRGPQALATYPSFSPRGPLDRLFYRGELRHVRTLLCRHSIAKVARDHLPVIADFELL